MKRFLGFVLAATTVVGVSTNAGADRAQAKTDRAATALDCARWRYSAADEPAVGVIPSEFDRSNYKRTSWRDTNAALFNSPQNHCGQMGMAVDLAWGVQQGRADVTIAILDSGIKWRDANAMADLATKAYINIGEASPPCVQASGGVGAPLGARVQASGGVGAPLGARAQASGGVGAPLGARVQASGGVGAPLGARVQASGGVAGDCNGDGRFNILDFGAIPDLNGNGRPDPEDLILNPQYSDGVDSDHNGYVDDISGWDFLYGDNDPLDTVNYGHGTGEAEDSSAAANGSGEVGSCPNCSFLPIRVGDSFIADGQRFAAGVFFALDSHAAVVQEALGVINNPSAAQTAIDLAYERNVVVVASMADEASKHPNLPAALRHTMAVNSVTKLQSLLGGNVDGYLALNGCTNYGGHAFVSVESGSCSSEATGISAGIVGLIESEARDLGLRLTTNEVMQIVRRAADDVDFATPNSVDPANNFGTSTGGLLDTVRYPTAKGWDATFGYGRMNAYEAVKAVRAFAIPPTADLVAPNWFEVLPIRGEVVVNGTVDAQRASSFDYRVEWTTGLQPPNYPGTDTWHRVANVAGLHHELRGKLATLNLQTIAAALPNHGHGAPTTAKDRPDEEKFSVRVRIVVTAHGGANEGLDAIDQHQVFVHDDPDLVGGFPRRIAGVGTASPVFAQLDGTGGRELVVGTDDGVVHAYRSNGSELPGFPVRTATASWWPVHSPSATSAHLQAPGAAIPVGGPAIGDLDHNGSKQIVANSLDGKVYVWDSHGQLRSGFPQSVNPAFSRDTPGHHDSVNRTKPAFVGSPALADLDGNGTLEIIAASADRHVYAWHSDATAVAGFPVLVVDPAKVAAVDPVTHAVTFVNNSGVGDGGELIATPALSDLDGDGHPDIVIGAQEEYAEPVNIGDGQDVQGLLSAAGTPGNSRLYAISSKGTRATYPNPFPAHPDAQAYLPGWPAKLGMLALESLPTIGDGVSAQAAIGDVTPAHVGREVVAAAADGPLYVLDEHGQSVYGKINGFDVPLAWAGGLDGSGLNRFGARTNSTDLIASVPLFGGAALGQMNRDRWLDPTAPAAGLTRLIDIQASDLQLPADDHLTAWNATTGNAFSGLPRTTPDMAFFVTPAVADLNGDGRNETIAGNGLYTLSAFSADGFAPTGWPKLTGGWLVGTPTLGDWNGDGRQELAVVRRDGVLIVWNTAATTSRGWTRFGGNSRNTGVAGR